MSDHVYGHSSASSLASVPFSYTDCVLKDLDRDWDLREHIRALPTKQNISLLIAMVETNFKTALEQLKSDTTALGHQVETLETGHEDVLQVMEGLQHRVHRQDTMLLS